MNNTHDFKENIDAAEQETKFNIITLAEDENEESKRIVDDVLEQISRLYRDFREWLKNNASNEEAAIYFARVKQESARLLAQAKEKIDAGYKVGIICTDESRSHYPEGEVRSIGARKSQASVAHNLYALLREFDDLKVDYIYSESFSQDHLGQAIMNRLPKAAGYQIYKV